MQYGYLSSIGLRMHLEDLRSFKSEESDKCRTVKDTNCANSIIKHPRTLLPHCTLLISSMKTGRLPSLTKVLASINKQNVLTTPQARKGNIRLFELSSSTGSCKYQ